MEYQLNFRKIIDALLSKILIIIIAAVVSLGIGIAITDPDSPDVYSATTTIYSASYASYRDSMEGVSAMILYADIVHSRKVAELASAYTVRPMTPEQIMNMISSSYSNESAVITVRALSEDPGIAISVANAVAEAFVQEVASIAAIESVKILDPAYTAGLYSSGSMTAMRMRAVVTAVGVVGIMAFIIAFAVFDTRVAFPKEVTLNGEIELLGVIPDKRI